MSRRETSKKRKFRTLGRRTVKLRTANEEREEREKKRDPHAEERNPREGSWSYICWNGRGVSTSFDECPSGVSATQTATETLRVRIWLA